MLDFESHFIYQDGIRDGLAVLAVQFSNDSIASQVVHVQSSQHYSMQVEDRDTLGIKFEKDSMGKPGVNTPAGAVNPADESVSPKTVSRKADMPLKQTPAVNRKLIAPRELKKIEKVDVKAIK